MGDKKDDKNPVLEMLHGVPIRNTNIIQLRVDAAYYRDLIEQSFKTTLSIAKIIIIRSEPCQQCKCDNVTLSIKKRKNNYHIASNGGTLIKNINGKGHNDTPENINS